ncbi:MAG: phosphatidylglycerol lysyltransferase domain-containing protein [Bacillota bacterium]|jgi:hypothetical protein
MMDTFKPISIEAKKDFDRVLTRAQPESSDFNFSNLWMWASTYNLTAQFLPELDYWLLLARPTKWKPFFFAPLGDWSDEDKLLAAWQRLKQAARTLQIQPMLRRVPRTILDKLLRLEPQLQCHEDRNTYDYLYKVESLIQLSGRKLHRKRNQLNQFLRKYQWTYQAMDPEVAAVCLELKTSWFDLKERNDENEAMLRLLRNFASLGLTGGVIRINGEIQALTVGEPLNRQTALIHIEKANTDYDGIYAVINQQFVSRHWSHLIYINREEDLGIEGLRQVKTSYQPWRLVEKYDVWQ